MTLIILILMLLMHIYEDFHVQGIMADMKQKNWWDSKIIDRTNSEEMSEEELDTYYEKMMRTYGKDYIPALLLHALEWSIFIHLPIILSLGIANDWDYTMLQQGIILSSVLINTSIHAYVDHMKCNQYRINLIQDQSIHIIQILITFIAMWGVLRWGCSRRIKPIGNGVAMST